MGVPEGNSMSESEFIKSWGAGCIRQVLIAVFIFLIFVAGLVGLVILSVLLPIAESQRIYIWVGGLLLFLFLIVGGLLLWNAHTIRRCASQLDAAFNQLGLSGRSYLWNGRQYHGTLNGRQVDAYFYRRPILAIYIASTLNTRLGIGLKGRISQMALSAFQRPESASNDPDLMPLAIYPLDEAWGRELLNNAQAKAVILRLTSAHAEYEFRNLLFQPEAIQFQIHRISLGAINSENLRIWINDLLDLATIAESLPPPSITSHASSMERKGRENRGDFILPILGITCGIIGFFTAIIIIIMILFVNLIKGGI
jgi:hypothetical protein